MYCTRYLCNIPTAGWCSPFVCLLSPSKIQINEMVRYRNSESAMQQPELAQSVALAAAGARGAASGGGVGGSTTFGLNQQAVVS